MDNILMSTSADSGCCSRLEDELSTSLNATEIESSMLLSTETLSQNNNQALDKVGIYGSTNGTDLTNQTSTMKMTKTNLGP